MKPVAGQLWQVVVQRPITFKGRDYPGYVQVDDLADGPGTSRWSRSPEQLRAEGWDVPDFGRLPTGRYRLAEALELLEQMC